MEKLESRVARMLHIAPRAEARPWYEIRNRADSGSTKSAEILIYDEIDPFWGVSAGDFANELNALDVDEITVGINSPGGIVFDGIAIMNALKRHPAKVIARIDGLAASAASFIAMAGDEIHTSKYAEMMIHEARGVVMGTAVDMTEMRDLLIRHNETIAAVYADRAGGDVKAWLKLMRNETWFSAEEMVAAGLADKVLDDSSSAQPEDSGHNRFDLSVFNYAGRKAAPAPQIRNDHRDSGGRRKEARMATTREHLASTLGLDAEAATDDELNVALDAKLAEATATGSGQPDEPGEPAGEQTADQVAASAAKHGFAVIDRDSLTALQDQAKRGAEAADALQAKSDKALVDDAIRAGKIPPVARDKYLTGLGADRETFTARLDALAADTIPVAERGHAVNPDPAVTEMKFDESLFEGWKI